MARETPREETLRESDGLAVSPANAGLSEEERRAAPGLFRALLAGHLVHALGERKAGKILAAVRMALEMEPGLRIESIELRDAETRETVNRLRGPALLEAVVHAGRTRLTDGVRLG
ncbi:MAG TPA: pantoate--beta-alanine ligase [Thermoanaerobaculia bacterium]